MIQSIQLNSIIYVDTTQHFRRHNPNIPSDVMFHTFLLDSDNKVILVGSPIQNNRIQNLFKKIIKEELAISVNDEDSQ